jgi:predicted DNA-binding transcriptional regulator AlpA
MTITQPLPVAFDPLLKPGEAADYLRVSKAALNKWRTTGRPAPRAFKTYSTLRYRVSDLDNWLKSLGEAREHAEASTAPGGAEILHNGPAPARLTLVTMQNYWYHVLHRDLLLSIDEAAQYLAIPKATLYTNRTRRPGWGPRSVEVGGQLRYRLSALNEWVESHLEPLQRESLTG